MSSSYKLLYQDRRQFIFEEAQQAHSTAIITLVAGFFGGSLLGVYFASLNATTAGSILLAIGTYITILTSAFSLKSNPLGVLLIFMTSFTTVIGLIYVSRITLEYLKESPFQIVLLYAGLFAIIAELLYLWTRLTWVEDTRMHQLIEINGSDHRVGDSGNDNTVSSFFIWIFEIISFTFLRVYYTIRGDSNLASKYPILIIESFSKWSGSESALKVSIVNETLKKVKVCVYHRHDYCCWLPVGGITWGMHELDRGEELVISPHWPAESFRVKIFAHGVIDYELASHPCVTRGCKYAFIDVGKPITVLSHLSSSPAISVDEESEISDNEPFLHVFEVPTQTSSGLRRVGSSRANLSALGSSEHDLSPARQSSCRSSPTANQRAEFRRCIYALGEKMENKIAVLNETTGDIKVYFYSIDDRTFVRSIDAMKVFNDGGTNVIPKHEWKIWEYTDDAKEEKFCLRVKSATPNVSLELSYCTAYLSEAIIVRDPIVTQ